MTRKTQRLEQTVIAHHIELGDDYTPRREWKMEKKIPNFWREVFWFSVLATILAGTAFYGWAMPGKLWITGGAVIGLLALLLSFSAYSRHAYSAQWEPAKPDDGMGGTEPEPEPAPALLVQIPRGDGRIIEFREPRPGEAAVWFRAILEGRVSLSQNTAAGRGWNREAYKVMLSLMRDIGWVQPGPNRTVEFTRYGEMRIREWLRR